MKGTRPRQRKTVTNTSTLRLAIPLLSVCALIVTELTLIREFKNESKHNDINRRRIDIGTPLEVNVVGHAVKALSPTEKCDGFDMFNESMPAPYCATKFMKIPYAMNKSTTPIFLCHVSLFRKSQQVVGEAIHPAQNCVYKLRFANRNIPARIGVVHKEMPRIFTHFHFNIEYHEAKRNEKKDGGDAMNAIKDVRLSQSKAIPYDSGSIPFTYTATWTEVGARKRRSRRRSGHRSDYGNCNSDRSFVGGSTLFNAAILMYAMSMVLSSLSTSASPATSMPASASTGVPFVSAAKSIVPASFVCCGTHLFLSNLLSSFDTDTVTDTAAYNTILTAPVISFTHPFFLSNPTSISSLEPTEVIPLVLSPLLSLRTSGHLSASAYFIALFLVVISYPLFHQLVISASPRPTSTSISVYRCAFLALPSSCAFIPVIFSYIQSLSTHNAPASIQMLHYPGIAFFHALVFATSGYMIGSESDSVLSVLCTSIMSSSYLVVYAVLLNLRSSSSTVSSTPSKLPVHFWSFAATVCFSGASASFFGATLHWNRYRQRHRMSGENTNLTNKMSP